MYCSKQPVIITIELYWSALSSDLAVVKSTLYSITSVAELMLSQFGCNDILMTRGDREKLISKFEKKNKFAEKLIVRFISGKKCSKKITRRWTLASCRPRSSWRARPTQLVRIIRGISWACRIIISSCRGRRAGSWGRGCWWKFPS